MRAAWMLLVLLAGACANHNEVQKMALPDWRGTPLHTRAAESGGLQLVMTVATGGHALRLLYVVRSGKRADVHLQYEAPSGDFVPQVISELSVMVPAEQLGDATAVCVWIRSGTEPARLALAAAR
jgi:hypothetical protein